MGLPVPRMSLQQFLDWEQQQAERHEFHRGEVYAMGGGSARHNRVILNLAARLSDLLESSGCQVFAESMQVRLADDAVLYPDVVVSCGKPLAGDERAVSEARLIVEVLSPSTRGYDRRDKFILYRSLASLQQYLLIDPSSREVEVFTRTAAGWLLAEQTGAEALQLSSLALALPMSAVFRGVEPG